MYSVICNGHPTLQHFFFFSLGKKIKCIPICSNAALKDKWFDFPSSQHNIALMTKMNAKFLFFNDSNTVTADVHLAFSLLLIICLHVSCVARAFSSVTSLLGRRRGMEGANGEPRTMESQTAHQVKRNLSPTLPCMTDQNVNSTRMENVPRFAQRII